MSYRGFGGFHAGDFRAIRRRMRAGDVLDGFDTGFDSGLDGGGGVDTSTGTPDFSDVTGGSSSVIDASDPGSSLNFPIAGLGNIGSAIQKYIGGAGTLTLPSAAGSIAAAGAASSVAGSVGKTVKRLARKFLGGGRHHRMNPGNFHALRRSMRRLQAFERAARRVYHFTHPTRGKSHFKFRRRKRR